MNPIQLMLDTAGIPWLSKRSELEGRFGVHPDPAYRWDVIAVATPRPFVQGLISPLSVQAFEQYSPHVPATDFTGIVWFGSDARENLGRVTEQLTRQLGTAAADNSSNTLGWEWAFGASRLNLTVWPPDMDRVPMSIPAHERDPRLAAGCHLSIQTGWRPALTSAETEWLAGFVTVAEIRTHGDLQLNEPAEQSQLEFVRDPGVGLDRLWGRVGILGDREALAFCHSQLFLVQISDVVGFHVERLIPAQGTGGSRLYVECRTHYEQHPIKRLLIDSSDAIEGLNELAGELSRVSQRPFELGAYWLDD